MKAFKAWAVALSHDDDFVPDFNVIGKMTDVLQIHSTKKAAKEMAKNCGDGWHVVEVTISPTKPNTKSNDNN